MPCGECFRWHSAWKQRAGLTSISEIYTPQVIRMLLLLMECGIALPKLKNARWEHKVRKRALDQELGSLDPAFPLPPRVIMGKSLHEFRPQLPLS